MAKTTLDFKQQLAEINKSLSVARLIVVKNKLYIRANYPPRPGEDTPIRTSIPTKCGANLSGLKIATLKAREIDNNLLLDKFDWTPFIKKEQEKVQEEKSSQEVILLTGDVVKNFEEDYWRKRKKTKATLTTYRTNYKIALGKLPKDQPLTIELLINTACSTTQPDTAARKNACTIAYRSLANFAGLPSSDIKELVKYKGNYTSFKPINVKHLPSDEEIYDYYSKIEEVGWKFIYALMAIYGARASDAVVSEHSRLTEDLPLLLIPEETKTGARIAYPCPDPAWEMDLTPQPLEFEGKSKVPSSSLIIYHLKTKPGLPFTPNCLRHCYARRMFLRGQPIDITAKSMGHSTDVHRTIYRAWWGEEPFQTRYLEVMKQWKERQLPSS